MSFSCDNATWTDAEPFQYTKNNFDIKSGLNGCTNADGARIVYLQLKDALGNIGVSNTGEFILNGSAALAQLTLAPSNPSKEQNPQFTVGGVDVVAYKFQIDDGDFSEEISVISNIQLINLVDGTHEIKVLGKNNAGTWQPENAPTIFTWLVDTTGPVLTITNAGGNPTNDVTPTLELSLNDAGVGAENAMVRFSCVDAPDDASETWTDFEPFQETKNNFDVHSILNGCTATDGSKVIFVQGRDSLLNLGRPAQTAEFVLDRAAPDITGLVSDAVPTKSKTWNWDSADQSATFRFSIDQLEEGIPDGEYVALKTATQPIGNGVFYIHVQAKDALGNESGVLTVSAVLDNTAPTAGLLAYPHNPTKFNSINMTVTGEGVTHYKFKIDAGNFNAETPVATPIILSDLSNGEHTLEVVGRDIAGNYQTELLSTRVTWEVNTSLLTAVLSGTPASLTNSTSADITVSGEGVDFYKFKLTNIAGEVAELTASDFGEEMPVATHVVLNNLTEGNYALVVIGKSMTGQYPSVAEATIFSWTIDLTPPVAVLAGAPTDTVTSTNATITVSGADVTHYKFILDAQPLSSEASVATPIQLVSLGVGSHTLKVIGRDAAGNYQTEANATSVMWVVATVPIPAVVGGGSTPIIQPVPTVQTPGKVLGVKTKLIKNGVIVKLKGKKQYYLIQSGKRVSITSLVFRKKYKKRTLIEVDKKTLYSIPLKKATKKRTA